jgi:hypothetical protein
MFLTEWTRRVSYLLNRRRLERELRQEMEAHREMLGEPAGFGNTLRLREEEQDVWGWRWLDDAWQDLRYGLRALRLSPGFALTAFLILSFGIGVNLTFFEIVNAALLRPLPVKDPAGLVHFYRMSETSRSLLLRQMTWPALLGIVVGVAASLPIGRAFEGEPFYLNSHDALPHAAALLVLFAAGGLAALLPTLRALRAIRCRRCGTSEARPQMPGEEWRRAPACVGWYAPESRGKRCSHRNHHHRAAPGRVRARGSRPRLCLSVSRTRDRTIWNRASPRFDTSRGPV